jgi:hypothetical protein
MRQRILRLPECIGQCERTQGTETSHVPAGKEREIDSVSSASERGIGQTGSNPGVAGLNVGAERLVEASWKGVSKRVKIP